MAETSEEGPEREEPAEPEPAPSVSDEEASEPPDARTLKERIDRLDETLAADLGDAPAAQGGDEA